MVVTSVPASGLYVVFRGTVAQINAAFSTTEQTYEFQGQSLIGPSTAPSLPANLAAKVQAISVDQGRLLTRPSLATPADQAQPSGKSVAPAPVDAPCSNYIGEHMVTVPAAYGKTSYSTYNCGYTPGPAALGYGISALPKSQNGAGQTVAIIDAYASPSIVRTSNTYSRAAFRRRKTAAVQADRSDPKQFVDQEACGLPSGWQGEQTLDVEAVHALAPGANILYVGGFNCGGGIDVAMSKILDANSRTSSATATATSARMCRPT